MKLNKIWSAINGKKTAIGIGLHVAWFVANMAFKNISTDEQAITGHALIFSVTGVGIGHKINKAIEKANNK